MDLTPRTSADNAPLAPRKRKSTWTAIAVLAVIVASLATAPVARAQDADGDGIPDASDNCPLVPNADQAVPFQRATPRALTPPIWKKEPPAMRSPLGRTSSALTLPVTLTPEPSGDHVTPFHRAMRTQATPPMRLKGPPTTRSPLGIQAMASMAPLVLLPAGPHETPLETAKPLTGKPLTTPRPDVPPTAHSPLARRAKHVPLA